MCIQSFKIYEVIWQNLNKSIISVEALNMLVSLTEKLEGLNDNISHLSLIYTYRTLFLTNALSKFKWKVHQDRPDPGWKNISTNYKTFKVF